MTSGSKTRVTSNKPSSNTMSFKSNKTPLNIHVGGASFKKRDVLPPKKKPQVPKSPHM